MISRYKFLHFRVIPNDLNETKGKPNLVSLLGYSRKFGWEIPKLSWKSKCPKPNPKGGKTICIAIDESGNEIFRTEAICSMSDNFCYKTGVKIAFGRAKNKIIEWQGTIEHLSHVALIDGELKGYDVCSDKGISAYDPQKFRFIGNGRIFAIHGVIQNSKSFNNMSFFLKKF